MLPEPCSFERHSPRIEGCECSYIQLWSIEARRVGVIEAIAYTGLIFWLVFWLCAVLVLTEIFRNVSSSMKEKLWFFGGSSAPSG